MGDKDPQDVMHPKEHPHGYNLLEGAKDGSFRTLVYTAVRARAAQPVRASPPLPLPPTYAK